MRRRFSALVASLGLACVLSPCPALSQPATPDAGVSAGADAATPSTPDAGAPAPVIVPPQLESNAELELPEGTEVPETGIEVLLSIDETGAVTEATLKQSIGPEADAAVLDAASRLQFRPALRGDQPIAVRVGFRFAPPAPAPPPTAAKEAAVSQAAAGSESTPAKAAAPPAAAVSLQPHEAPTSYGARGRVERPPPGAVSRIKLRGAELTQVPGTFGEPLRVVATLPGVARTPFGFGFFVVRGASFQNTGFFVDNYPVPLLYHLGAGPAIIASRLVDSLDFYAGGYPVSLGRYTAGVIGVHTQPPEAKGLTAEFELDALRASALVVMPLPKQRGSVAVALRRSYYDLLLPLITNSVSLAYTDYQLRLDLRITDQVRFSLFFFGSRDSFETRQALGGTTAGQGVNTGLHYAFDQLIAAVDWEPSTRLKLRWSGTIGPSRVRFENDRAGADSLGTDTPALRLGERLTARWIASDQFETRLGLDIDVFLTNLSASAPSIGELPGIPSPGPPTTAIELKDQTLQLGVAPFIEQVWRPGPLEVTVGLRAEYLRYGSGGYLMPDPRAVLRYEIAKRVWLKAGSGLFSQPPLPFQVLRQAGNPKLRPNRALQNSVGAELKLPFDTEVETNLYYNAMWQLTRASSDRYVDAQGHVRPAFYADDGRGRSYGWELLVRRRMSKGLFGWLSYTLSRSERFLSGGQKVVFNFDQTHVLNFAVSYKLGAYRFGTRLTLATGRPVTDLLDPSGQSALFDADQNNLTPSARGRRTRLPTYQQLDVRLDRDFDWGVLTGSFYIDVINVYNAKNSEAYQYEYDFSKRGRLPGLPFLPTLGIRGVLR